ncbi:MAG: SDR family oxidoreductase [Chloroflexi bacterium]|nr:SDR family oxidoreductase [Chloroflexota bacterium]
MSNIDNPTEQYFNHFHGHTSVITGGAGALGGQIANALAACGANIAILDRNRSESAESLLSQYPDRSMFIDTDVLNKDGLSRAEEAISNRWKSIDSLVNVAGGHHPHATATPSQSFFDLTEEGLRHVVDLNLFGTILPTQVFGRGMAERGDGAILNISSVSSFHSLTRVVAYSAAKAAVNNLTQWLAVHMAQVYSPRIRVNAIAPGFYLTDVNRTLLSDAQTGEPNERAQTIVSQTPMGRMGDPPEIVSTALWLLSPASSFVTGLIVPVDGGFTAFSGV